MKKLILLFILSATSILSQISLNVSVRQPTPSSINVWQNNPSILQLFVNNTSTTTYKDAYFSFSIYDDNKIVAYTKENDPTLPKFIIPAGPPSGTGVIIINGPQLVRVGEIHFDKNLGNSVISTNSLPEGQYRLCIKAFDSRGVNITNNEQTCTYFSIRIPEPPTLISPFDGDTLLTNYQTFSWSPITGGDLEFGLKYKLKITPLFSGQNGRTAIESNPILIDKLVTAPIYTYLPSDPSFTLFQDAIGFAWQVQALTAAGEPATRLNGKSEIRIFYKKKFQFVFSVKDPKLFQPENNSTINTKTPTLSWSYFPKNNENVYYQLKIVELDQFDYPLTAIDKNTAIYYKSYNTMPKYFGSIPQTNFIHNRTYAWRVQITKVGTNEILRKSNVFTFKYQNTISEFSASFTKVNGKLMYQFADPGEYTGLPLASANIKLVVKYVMNYTNHVNNTNQGDRTHAGSILLLNAAALQLGLNDVDKVLSVATTSSDGSFSFTFLTEDSSDVLVKKDVKYLAYGSNDFQDNYYGDVYRQYKIMIENPHSPYYTSPTENIIVQPNETKNMGNIFSHVRSYGLTVTIKPGWEGEQFTHEPIGNMIVYLLRDQRPFQVPDNEGWPKPEEPETLFGKEVIAKTVTSGAGSNKGKVHFKRLVKNLNSSDKYYLWSVSEPEKGKENYKSASEKPVHFKFNEDAIFNNEYKYPNFERSITVRAQLPQVAGKVIRGDSKQPLRSTFVELLNWDVLFWSEEAHWNTFNNGLFKFKSLLVNTNENFKVNGPFRVLRISKYGFVSRTIDVIGKGLNSALTIGEKWQDYNIELQPESKITGRIVNENGLGVKAKVELVGGLVVDSKTTGAIGWGPAEFELPSPKGLQTIIIDPTPYTTIYYKDTISVNVTESIYDIGTHTLTEKMHHLIVNVKESSGGIFVTGNEPWIYGARVQLKDRSGNEIEHKTANKFGKVQFDFKSSSNKFTLNVQSPLTLLGAERRDYETKEVNIEFKNPNSRQPQIETIYIKKATFISGGVYVGTEKKPIHNARVQLVVGGETIDTYTNMNGKYILGNVPIKNYQKFSAAKAQSSFIGDEKYLNVPKDGLENVDFLLTVYEGMDISKLMGFPIEVVSLTETGNQVKISGSFVKLDSLNNPIFATSETTIPFSNVTIVPGSKTRMIYGNDVPMAIPKELPVRTSIKSMPLTIFDEFNGKLTDENNFGIELIEGTNNIGVIGGNCFVDAGTFKIHNDNLSFSDNGFYLKEVNSSGLKIPVITATAQSPVDVQIGFNIVNKEEEGLRYSLYGFEADADIKKSFLRDGKLILNTTLHTNLQNVEPTDLELNIDDVSITPTKINPISGETPITFNLDQWTMEINKWKLDGYLSVQAGTLHTNIVDVPLTELFIEPDRLSQGVYDLTNMTIGGIPLEIAGEPVVGYDNSNNYWFLSIGKGSGVYAASFSGLPGMEPNQKILIDAFTLTSKGNQFFSPVYNQTPSIIHKVGILNPNSIEAFDNYVEISGLTFNIPGYSQSTSIQYGIQNNAQVLSLVSNNINLDANGVRMEFGLNENDATTQQLDANGFRGRGKVFELGKFSLDTWLYHTVDSTSIWVEQSPLQTLPIGGSAYLGNVNGSMRVQNGSWTNFSFSGDMLGTKGVEEGKNRMTFVVEGEIKASGQELGIKNMDTPFGDMSWTYEFENSRLIGNLEFSIDVSSTHIDGQAETLVDPSGWYLIAGGKMKLPGLGPAQAAILVGDYPLMPQSVRDIFAECSYKKGLPESFEAQISGFLFSGSIAIPIIIPDVEFDLEILYAKLGIHAGGDARLWMNFDGSGNEYGIGLLAFVHAFVEAGSITCTEVSAHATAELGAEGSYHSASGKFSFDGCGSLSLGVHVTQKLYACNLDGCGCMGTIFDSGFEYGIKNLIHFDSDKNRSFKFELGTCSDQ